MAKYLVTYQVTRTTTYSMRMTGTEDTIETKAEEALEKMALTGKWKGDVEDDDVEYQVESCDEE